MKVANKRGIITGAASGLGRALAVALGKEGWDLILADIDQGGAEQTLAMVRKSGGEGQIFSLDVRDESGWLALRSVAESRWQYCDLLINNAGVSGSGLVGQMPLEDWRWLFEINFFGYLNGCHYFLEWLKRNPEGSAIVNTCSASAVYSCPTMGAYSAAKAAVLSLSETLFSELQGTKVSTTVVCPYFFKTNLLSGGRFQRSSERSVAEEECAVAAVTAEDIARITIRAMKRKQFYVFVPFFKSRMVWFMKRMFPGFMLWVLAYESRRRLKLAEAR